MEGPPEPRIINGVEIVFGERSKCDVPSWDCPGCFKKIKTIRYLVFDFPPLYCIDCNIMNPNNFSFNLATVLMNGISPVGEVKEQKVEEGEEGQCVGYAVAQLAEMMNRIIIACSSEQPVISAVKTQCFPKEFIDPYAKEFPIKPFGAGLHKMLRMLSILLTGVPMKYMVGHKECVSHLIAGNQIRAIHCDDFEEVCRQIADGNPLLAPLHVGALYDDLQYCQYYTAIPASAISVLQAEKKLIAGHVVVLIGAISENGHRAYFALDSAGVGYCRQVGSAGVWSALFKCNEETLLGGYGKITAGSNWMHNFFKLSRLNDDGLPPKYYDEYDSEADTGSKKLTDLLIAPQVAGDDMISGYNHLYAFHGKFFRRRFEEYNY